MQSFARNATGFPRAWRVLITGRKKGIETTGISYPTLLRSVVEPTKKTAISMLMLCE